MEKIITCEISFIPIATDDYEADVNKALDIIKSFDLEITVGLMSTTCRGKKELIFEMIEKIFDEMYGQSKFTMDVKLSNECGC